MTTYRCPHRPLGRIVWPLPWPPKEGPHARVDVCENAACRDDAHRKVEEITGHTGQYLPYPVKASERRPPRPKPAAPRQQTSRAQTAAVPWDVLGALIFAAPTEIEEWAEERLGTAVVTQAIKAAEVTEISA